MKQMRMRIISVVMSFLLIFSGLPMGTVPAWAAEPAASGNTLTATPGNAAPVQEDRTASASDADDDGEIDDGIVIDDRAEAEVADVPADPEKEVKDADVLADPVKTEVIEKAAATQHTVRFYRYDMDTEMYIVSAENIPFDHNTTFTFEEFNIQMWIFATMDYELYKVYSDPDLTEEVTFPLVINSDMELYGVYRYIGTAPKYTVSVTSGGGGTASANKTSGRWNVLVTLTAKPSSGYEFYKWEVISGNVTIASDNTFRIGTENVEIKAIFETKQNLCTVTIEDPYGYYPTSTFKVRKGDPVELPSSIEANQYTNGVMPLLGWKCVDGEDAYSPEEGIQRNLTFRPMWRVLYTIVEHDMNGNLFNSYSYHGELGSTVAIADLTNYFHYYGDYKYRIKYVYSDPAMTNEFDSYLPLNSDKLIFYAKSVKLVDIKITNDDHGKGYVAPPGSGSGGRKTILYEREEGSGPYTLSAVSNEPAWSFKEWEVVSGGVTLNKAVTSADNSFSVGGENVEIKAVFHKTKQAIRFYTTESGTTWTDQQYAQAGTKVTVKAIPNDGYRFSNWIVESGGVTLDKGLTSAENSFTMGTEDVVLMPVFSPTDMYSISGHSNGNGYFLSDISFAQTGTKVTLTAMPDDGYKLSYWEVRYGGVTLDKDVTSAENSFTLGTQDVYIVAVFEEKTQVESVILNTSARNLSLGETFQLKAWPQPTDASNKAVTWTSSNPAVATVDSTGLVKGIKVGTTTITVKTVSGEKTASCVITVGVLVTSVKINTTAKTLEAGETFQLAAWPQPTNASIKTVTWTSSKPSVATVSSTGLVTAIKPGTATMTVKTVDGGKTATCVITVPEHVEYVNIILTSKTMVIGKTFHLVAWPQPSTATNKAVTWTSSNPAVATVDSTGLVKAVKTGTAIITVKTEDGGHTAECVITVNGSTATVPVTSVKINSAAKTIEVGKTFQLAAWPQPTNATNKNVTWTSSNTAVATVSSTGLVKGVKAGTVTITVKTADGGYTATCKITVQAATATVPVTSVKINTTAKTLAPGATFQLAAWPQPTNATNKAVTWTSSNTAVAKVSSTGEVTAVKAGTATITVKTADGGYTATCKITVQAATTVPVTSVKINSTAKTLAPGATFQLAAWPQPTNATNKAVTWSSSNSAVAKVSSAGLVTAVKAGTATITVKTADGGKTATCKITVQAATVAVTSVKINSTAKTLAAGATFQLAAWPQPTNATNKAVTWSSSNAAVAKVSSAGLVTAVKKGTATITVKTADGGKTATCKITVN